MGIFSRTEEEIRKDEERKLLVELRDAIKSNNKLNSKNMNTLISCIDNALYRGINDFIEVEFLCRVLIQLDINIYYNNTDVEEHLNKIISCIKDLLPEGIETEHYNKIKEMIINDFVGPTGYINKGLYDYKVFYTFKSYENYNRLMKMISHNEKATKNYNLVKDFLQKAAKYTTDEETFVRSVVSTIGGIDEGIINVKEYLEMQLEEDKKRVGVYSISHDDIIKAQKSVDKNEELLYKIDNDIETLKEVNREAKRNKEEIISEVKVAKEESIKEIKDSRKQMESESKQELDEYIEKIKVDINEKADAVFAEILIKYKEQLEEFRKASRNLSQENTRRLIQIQNETDKSLNELRDYVSNHPELKEYLDRAEQSNEIKNKIIELIAEEKKNGERTIIKDNKKEKIIEGIDKIVVPDSPKIELPKSIEIPKNVQIIPAYAFKNAQDFAKRRKEIENLMKYKEAKGEIFHQKTLEIIECLMVGDWPYMFGPSGAGKGHIVRQVGELLNQSVVEGGKIGDVPTILGYIDAQGRFRVTPAFVACVNGALLFYDEIDNGNADSLIALNTIYSNLREKIRYPLSEQYIKFAGEFDVPINPNMRLISAGNTDGSGADQQHTERYPIDESIKERYKAIFIPYDNRVEAHILRNYPNWFRFFINFRNVCESYSRAQGLQSTPGNASTRDAADILRDICFNAKTLEEMINQYFVQTKDEDYRGAISRDMANIYNISNNQIGIENYKGTLENVEEQEIARQFVKRCNLGIRG